MDKQSRIAFGLIFLLLIAYYGWLSRYTPDPPENPVSMEQTLPEAPLESREPPPAPIETPREFDGGFSSSPQEVARRIVVETPKSRFTLSGTGAVLQQVELLEFDAYNENNDAEGKVQLLAPDATPVLDLELEFSGGSLNTGSIPFACELPSGQDSLYLAPGEETTIRFLFEDGSGGKIFKTYTFHADRYDFGLMVDAELAGNLTEVRSYGLSWDAGIQSTEKNRKDDLRSFHNFYLLGDKLEKKGLRSFKGDRRIPSPEGSLRWVATKNKYFLAALIPDGSPTGWGTLTGSSEEEKLGFRADIHLRGGQNRVSQGFQVYAGPILMEPLKAYGNGLEDMVDLGKWIRPISLAIKWLMGWLYHFIPNYGLVIILLSVFTKLLFYRLSHKSFKSMKDMQAVQPELKKLQEKYKNDKQKLQQATMELYKEHGVNPLGGCLPLLFQMPVFFALFRVLRGAVELRGAGFVAWIDDLSNMDVLYRLPFDIPLLGGFIDNSISLLPILMGLSMVLQMKLGGSGMGGGVGQPAQAQAMNKIMPFFMTFIFYRMPSGLVLYWLVNNILTVAQQYYIHRGSDDSGTVITADSR